MKKHLLEMKKKGEEIQNRRKWQKNKKNVSKSPSGKQQMVTVLEQSGEDDYSEQNTMQTEVIEHIDYQDIPAYPQIFAKFDDYGLESAIENEIGMTQPPSMLTHKIEYR